MLVFPVRDTFGVIQDTRVCNTSSPSELMSHAGAVKSGSEPAFTLYLIFSLLQECQE